MDISVKTETFGDDDQRWLGSAHAIPDARPVTLDTSAFTAGTHYPNGYFPSGLPLAKITATGLYGPYNDSLSTGQEVLAGFLLTPIKPGSPTTVDVQGALLWHGDIVEAFLPVAIDSAGKVDIAAKFQIR